MGDISKLFGVFKTPNGNIYWINPTVIGTDGRAVGADNLGNTAGFSGQIFFNPVANQVGSLPILAFNAPSVWQVDALLAKRFSFAKRYTTDFRIEAFNVFNSVSFYSGDYQRQQHDVRAHHERGGRSPDRAADGSVHVLANARSVARDSVIRDSGFGFPVYEGAPRAPPSLSPRTRHFLND